ncbi:MAG: hypothetical protein HOQ05_13535 [Corynebacteriales bacterium]|nr:hypothetical protein [Mycobacteriales bacterium]
MTAINIREYFDTYPELTELVGEVATSPDQTHRGSSQSTLAHQRFPRASHEQLIEVNRTLVAILALKWLVIGDYESFTECQSGWPNRLTESTFQELHTFVKEALEEDRWFAAAEALVADNDLFKVKKLIAEVNRRCGTNEDDHDRLLLLAIERCPDLTPSISRLDGSEKALILSAMRADFNVPQFVQLEGVAADLLALPGTPVQVLNFKIVEALADVAGAGGANIHNGSITVDEATARNFLDVARAVDGMNAISGYGPDDAYLKYLQSRARRMGYSIAAPSDVAVVRLTAMLRENPSVEIVKQAIDGLNPADRLILTRELAVSGTGPDIAILPYYGPVLLRNSLNEAVARGTSQEQALVDTFGLLARQFQQARLALREQTGPGVVAVTGADLARNVVDQPARVAASDLRIIRGGTGARTTLESPTHINKDVLATMRSLDEIPGERIVLVGAGGGSDGVQAAMVAQLLAHTGKDCSAVISVRGHLTSSQGPDGTSGVPRTVINPDGELASGHVHEISEQHRGSGRFLEHVPAGDQRMFLVIDDPAVDLAQSLRVVIDQVGGADTVIVVDTGGDSLYREAMSGSPIEDQRVATPDQDLRTLRAASALADGNRTLLSCIVAPGLDAPINAEETLVRANAEFLQLDFEQSALVRETYARWKMDGSDPARPAKTPLGWLAALEGKLGRHTLPIAPHLVDDMRNPWLPSVYLSNATAGLVFMKLNEHLQALAGSAPNQPQRTVMPLSQADRSRHLRRP